MTGDRGERKSCATHVARAHNYMMDVWTWEFAFDCWDVDALEEMLFWYAASGQAISHESTTERWWTQISSGDALGIKAKAARERWADIRKIAPEIRALDQNAAFGWFLNGRSGKAWELLQEIKYVGPKIASWVLRDVSFLNDYADDVGKASLNVGYAERRGQTAWFSKLAIEDQALFLPLDRWVIRRAEEHGIIPVSTPLARIQGNVDRYIKTARAIASWALDRDLDPRDLDVYWYLTGEGSLADDGLCPIHEGDDVWWCYDGGDRVDPAQDWLEGNVETCTPTEATIRVEGQLCDPESGSPIAAQSMRVSRERLRPDE